MNNAKKKITASWILYLINVIPAIIWVVSAWWLVGDVLFDFQEYTLAVYPEFFFDGGTIDIVRMNVCAAVLFVVLIFIIVSGKKEIFSVKDALFFLSPFIIGVVCTLTSWQLTIGSNSHLACFVLLLINIFLFITTQIYLIIKLAKATKQLKA